MHKNLFNKNGGMRKNVARGSTHYVEINPISKPCKTPKMKKTTTKTSSNRTRTSRANASSFNIKMPIWLSILIVVLCSAIVIGLPIYMANLFGV